MVWKQLGGLLQAGAVAQAGILSPWTYMAAQSVQEAERDLKDFRVSKLIISVPVSWRFPSTPQSNPSVPQVKGNRSAMLSG